jgi:hypothetical protein
MAEPGMPQYSRTFGSSGVQVTSVSPAGGLSARWRLPSSTSWIGQGWKTGAALTGAEGADSRPKMSSAMIR